ncbi:hypothetical protein Bca4012_096125 [Brassica carinata]
MTIKAFAAKWTKTSKKSEKTQGSVSLKSGVVDPSNREDKGDCQEPEDKIGRSLSETGQSM